MFQNNLLNILDFDEHRNYSSVKVLFLIVLILSVIMTKSYTQVSISVIGGITHSDVYTNYRVDEGELVNDLDEGKGSLGGYAGVNISYQLKNIVARIDFRSDIRRYIARFNLDPSDGAKSEVTSLYYMSSNFIIQYKIVEDRLQFGGGLEYGYLTYRERGGNLDFNNARGWYMNPVIDMQVNRIWRQLSIGLMYHFRVGPFTDYYVETVINNRQNLRYLGQEYLRYIDFRLVYTF